MMPRSKELVSVDFLREERSIEILRKGARAIDLTLIYNQHGRPADAEQSIAYVEPCSFAFIEGYNPSGGQSAYESDLTLLNDLRQREGIAGEYYQQLKSLLQDEISGEMYRPAQHASDFMQHKLREIFLLLEKDCIIYYADFKFSQDKEARDRYSAFYKQFSELSNSSDQYVLPEPLSKTESVARTILNTQKIIQDGYAFPSQREQLAFITALQYIGLHAAGISVQKDVNTNEQGNPKAYMPFGTSHAQSLTHLFLEAGTSPDVVIVKPIHQGDYIDRSVEAFNSNQRRRIGYGALKTLVLDYLGLRTWGDISDELYESLDTLNKDKDEALKFLIRCIQVRQAESTDQERALRLLGSLLRDHVADPRKYIF